MTSVGVRWKGTLNKNIKNDWKKEKEQKWWRKIWLDGGDGKCMKHVQYCQSENQQIGTLRWRIWIISEKYGKTNRYKRACSKTEHREIDSIIYILTDIKKYHINENMHTNVHTQYNHLSVYTHKHAQNTPKRALFETKKYHINVYTHTNVHTQINHTSA